MKKSLSIIFALLIFLQALSQGVYALTPANVNNIETTSGGFFVSGTTSLGTNFLSNIRPGIVSVNFQDITSINAGKEMAVWTDSTSFPKEFVLPQDMSIKINQNELNSKLVKINRAKQNKTVLERAGVSVGEISSQLVVLPDRIQLKEKTILTFKTNSQLELIKSKVYGDDEFSIQLSSIKGMSKGNSTQFDNLKAINELESNVLRGLGASNLGLSNIDKLPQSESQINTQALLGLQKECENQYGKNDSQCSLQKIAREMQLGDKIVELEEKIEISLIPPSTIGGNNDFIKMDPNEIRISRGQILDIFKNYGLVLSQIEDEGEYPAEAQPFNPPRENPLTEDYCNDRTNPVACKQLLDEKNDITQQVYTKDLLNGFTLGEASSYSWSKKVKVSAFGVHKTLAKASVTFYYSYGVGLRIPIQGAVLVKDSALDDFRTSSQDYKIRIGLKTLDADAQYYSNVGLPGDPNKNGGNDGKLFEGKEFVLEFGAGIKVDIWVIGDVIDFHQDIGLMSILATYFGDILSETFGLSSSEISTMKSSNKLDKGKQFTPAFLGNNNVDLLDISSTIPIYTTAGFQLLAKLTLNAYLGGDIKFDCNTKNSIGGCVGVQKYTNKDLSIVDWSDLSNDGNAAWELPSGLDDYKWKEYSATATYTDNGRLEDDLGFYQNYGPILSNFMYIPKLVVKLFAKGGIKVYLPILGWESYWTKNVEVFSMEYSTEALALETHEGTDGIIDATTKNNIYGTDPSIAIVNPYIDISKFTKATNKGLSTSELTIETNQSHNTYDMYTIFPIDSNATQKNPYCENARDGRDPNGIKREGLVSIWDNPQDEAISNKSFDIRARGCALNGAMTNVVTQRANLENLAFDVYLFPGGRVGLNQPKWEYSVHTYDRVYPMSLYADKGMTIKYTLDGSTPSCDNNGNSILFDGDRVDLVSIGKEKLTNEFDITLSALACNNQNQTINKVSSIEYTIKNNAFDPIITINNFDNKLGISSLYYNHDGYYTYISYSLTKDDPTCNSPVNYIDIHGGNGINYFGLLKSVISTIEGATVKAKTCIRNSNNTVVFESDIVSRKVNGLLQLNQLNQFDFIEKVEEVLDINPVELGDIFGGFGGNIGDDFMNELGGLLGGNISMDGLVGFNTLMAEGGFGPDVFGGMARFGRKGQQDSLLGMAGFVKDGKMTRGTLMTFNNMFEGKQITSKGLASLSSLYTKYNIHYVGLDASKSPVDKNDLGGLKDGSPIAPTIIPVYDEYVQSKVEEINQCHVDLYNSQIQEIDDTISGFTKTISESKDNDKRLKYIKAIEKLENIKTVIEIKYKSLFGIE